MFHFTQKGDVLSGQYDGLFGKSPVKGKVMGDLVEFAVSGEYEGQSVSATYKGKMKPDGSLSGEVTFNDEINLNWAAKRQN